MGTTGRRCSVGLRGAAVLAAVLLWSAPAAQAVPLKAGTVSTVAFTSGSWGVWIMSDPAPVPPYAVGGPVAVSGALVASVQYFTAVSTGTRSPAGVTYVLDQNLGLMYTATMCTTPWSGGSCAGGSVSVPFNSNAPQTSPALLPSNGRPLYLRVMVAVGSSATISADANQPTVRTTTNA